MDTILVMAAGVAVGRFFPAKYRKQNEWVQLACTLLLIFSMGLGLGQQPDFFSDLAALGLSSLLFFLLPTAGSVAAVWLLTRRRGGPAHGRPASAALPAGAPRPRVGDPMMFFALGAVGLGLVCGAVSPLAAALAPVRDGAQWILYLLMFCVGITLGNDRTLAGRVRRLDPRLALLPVATAVGTLAGAALAAPLLAEWSLTDSLAVGAGFGYYSLSSIFIADFRGPELATIALLCNVMREIFTLLAAPLVARWCGPLAAVSIGGATTFDTTLPIITQAAGRPYAVVSVFHGCVLDFSVPFLVTFFCTV